MAELTQVYSELEIKRLLENLLLFGLYPEVVSAPTAVKARIIGEIADSYLYRDILGYQALKKHDLLEKLLQALALQIGNEVSCTKLDGLLGLRGARER